GETRLASGSAEFCGGKGANQAVAAARAGGIVSMIGSVGDDPFAKRLIDNLHENRIDTDAVRGECGQASGLAVITVDREGQNSIIVLPGANERVTIEWVEQNRSVIEQADCLIVQLEIPYDSVMKGIEIARQSGVRTILDPAPAPTTIPSGLFGVDLVCPNETEAALITRYDLGEEDALPHAASKLRSMGARKVAITLGEKGTFLSTGDAETKVPSLSIDPVDTTAAGDAYAGALAVEWCRTDSLERAVQFASAAGALAACKAGAQQSIANEEEIRSRL
ncbi:MAG: ribokinase, partial [Planctomycetota bacterium]